jgi:hypothetical protein
MATGIAKNTTIIGLKQESTEGTYVAPGAATDFIQPLEGFDIAPKKDTVERTILTSSIGKVTPRVGQKSVTASVPVEFRASGTEGAVTDFDLLLKGALGNSRAISTTTTTKSSGNTGSVLQIEDADISKFNVGDIVVIKETGAHQCVAITAKSTGTGTASITVLPSKPSGNFSNSVVISKSTTYYPANSGHIPLSLSVYWANEILQTAFGCKVTKMSLDNFSVGNIASLGFEMEGLGFDESNGSAGFTPSYDSGIPPLILSACLYQDGVDLPINSFGLNLQNTLGFITSTCSANGKISSRVTARTITGSLNPYKDDTDVGQYTKFNANTEFSLFVSAHNPSSTSGEFDMGSVIGIYLPKCLITEKKIGDQNGILTDELTFAATRGVSGATEEMYIGFI